MRPETPRHSFIQVRFSPNRPFVNYRRLSDGPSSFPQLDSDKDELDELFAGLRRARPDGAYAEAYACRIGDAFRQDILSLVDALSRVDDELVIEPSFFLAYNCDYFDIARCAAQPRDATLAHDLSPRQRLATNSLLAVMDQLKQ